MFRFVMDANGQGITRGRIPNVAPEWNEKLASFSEAAVWFMFFLFAHCTSLCPFSSNKKVKADHTPKESVEQMQSETVETFRVERQEDQELESLNRKGVAHEVGIVMEAATKHVKMTQK